jgi:predicted DCC family thiol-disulfide oxidoreductase YuxK
VRDMKKLTKNVIIYDSECPMCALYTGAFTQYGWLDKDGRWEYAAIDKFAACKLVDKERAKNEIALVDIEKQEVRYGLDSMLHIVGYNLPILKPLFANKLFFNALKQLYMLISYNRKVIAPSSKQTAESCIPDFNVLYRFAYIMLALYAVLALAWYVGTAYQMPVFLPTLVAGFWLLSALASLFMMKESAIIYLGQLVTTLLIAGLLAVPLVWFTAIFGHSFWVEAAGLGLVAIIFVQQFIRRLKVAIRDYKVQTFF